VDDTLDADIRRIAAAEADGMRLAVDRRADPGGPWFTVTELLESDGAPAVLLSRIAGMTGPPPEHIRAEWLFESFARVLGEVGAAFLLATGRLPELTAGNLLMASRGGLIAGVALRSDRMGVPAPGRDEPPVATLRESLVALTGPFAAWFDRHGLRPEKTLWKSAADRIAEATFWAGRAFDQPEAARELASGLLAVPGPLQIPLETVIDPRGTERHRRVTCCLAYRAAGGSLCFACPLNRRP
jgi:hypothetical protein